MIFSESRLPLFGIMLLDGGVASPFPKTLYRPWTHGAQGTAIREESMLDDVYNAKILDLAGNIPRIGRLADAHATATAHSRLCGSTVTVDVKMENGRVSDFAHEVRACALGQASSSIMARTILGATSDELRQVREEMRRMLKENGPPPDGKWDDLKFLEPVRDYKARHASTMLTFDAVVDAVGQVEARQAGGAAA